MDRNQNSREKNSHDSNRRDGQRDNQRGGQGQRYSQNQRGGQGQKGNQRKGPRRDAPKRASIINLANYKDKQIRLTFSGVHDCREVIGYLKGYDQLMNLVLDDAEEILKSKEKRVLGRVIVRGPKLVSLALADGSEEVANPFVQNEEAEENRI